MKRLIFLVLCLSLVLISAEQEVVIKEMPTFWYTSMEFQGSFQQMETSVGKFIQEFFKQSLTPTGALMGIYHNSPMEVKEEDLKWEIGFPVTEDADIKEPLKKTKFEAKKVAVYLHIGPYEDLGEAYMKVFNFITEKGYKMDWPTYDRYLNDPSKVKPEELRTETIIPIKE